MSEMLRVAGVSKAFDGFSAVRDADLTVARGSIVAVIGPNGAGKTTLLNLITGFLRPDRGQIVFEGEEISRLTPHEICRRRIGRTFQLANIFPRLSVFANVQVSVLSHQRRSRDLLSAAAGLGVHETTTVLESTGLAARARSMAGVLSHGDQRILEIAIALASEPRLLVLDEPTAGMSPEDTAATTALIRRLARERGLAIILCEHDMEVVFSVAESVMVLHQGRTLVQGPPDVVRQNRDVQDAYLGTTDA